MSIHRIYGAISPLFRRSRLKRMCLALGPIAGEQILDVGGVASFWNGFTLEAQITLLNLPGSGMPTSYQSSQFRYVDGDGCNLPFPERSFDIVFSNSAIEHVGTWERQLDFAREARRVGRRLWVQTPAREFFIEPHLIAPFIHWFPRSTQRRLIRNFTIRGWFERPDAVKIDAFLEEVRLLKFAEMQTLFPDCTILRERFLGMTKSYIAVRTSS
jgi:SAM-dependent methyltransferase